MKISIDTFLNETKFDNLAEAANMITGSTLARDKCLTLFSCLLEKSPQFSIIFLLCEKEFLTYTQSIAALMFETGRLYGRQQIMDETLEEIK